MSVTTSEINEARLQTRKYRQQRLNAITIYTLMVVIMMLLYGWLVKVQHDEEIVAAELRTTARANVVTEWAKGVLAQSGQALLGVTELLALQGIPHGDNTQDLQRLLENLTQYFPVIDNIVVLRADGRIVASSSGERTGVDVDNTHFFNAFLKADQPEMITPLYWSSSDQHYYLYHGRRLDSPTGDFVGWVISRIVPQSFTDALQQMSSYEGESIALVDPGFKLIARSPDVGEQLITGTQLDKANSIKWLASGEAGHSFTARSPIDGRMRLFRMQWVGDYPMLAVVGVDLNQVLAGWRQSAWIFALIILVSALFGAWAVRHSLNRLALAHQLRQRIEERGKEREEAHAEAQIAAAAFQTHLGILITDAQGLILKANDTFKRITGYQDFDLVGENPRIFSSGLQNKAFYWHLWKLVAKTGHWEGEIWNQRKNGELFPEWLSISAVYSLSGELTHYVATMSDISERKAAEQEIHKLAFYDPLTGLVNRRLFMDRIETALKECHRYHRCGALLLIDIDNFKQINDTLGHFSGDELLQAVARKLSRMLRDTDTLARLGSDEFAVLIEGIEGSPAQTNQLIERIAHKLLAILSEPIELTSESITVSGCIGITVISSDEHTIDDYLQQVDMALFQAKRNGRHSVCFFDPSMQAALLARVKLETDLRLALAEEQWQLYYQPQVNHRGVIIGVEALLRWHHPDRGMVSPGDFIPLLESDELINDVGEWALEKACYQLATWSQHPQLSQLSVSVNISPLQVRDERFLHRVTGVLARTKAPATRLKLEVTESLFMEARDNARDKMLWLKAQGVSFALDDFGTGYSSLAYLAQLPLDQLKIDQSFVQQVLESTANAAIVESTIALAESLNLNVIAEGVETDEQQAWLLAHHCYAYQGYLFGHPVTAKAIEKLMLKG